MLVELIPEANGLKATIGGVGLFATYEKVGLIPKASRASPLNFLQGRRSLNLVLNFILATAFYCGFRCPELYLI